jgi:hypothetical protein
MEAVSRVWRIYLLGCKYFVVVTYHATLVHLLQQSNDKLTDKYTHWMENFMPYTNLMRIIYMKGILNKTDPVLDVPISSLSITRTFQTRVYCGMEKCLTLILLIMALHY